MKVLTVTFNPCIDKTITIDGFNYGGLNRAEEVREDMGGKGINVAKVLKSFDIPCTAYTFVAGLSGKRFSDALAKNGIDIVSTEVKGEIRTNQKLVNLGDKVTTEINEKGFCVSSDDCQKAFEVIKDYLDSDTILVLAGSIPSGMDDSVYAELTRFANSVGTKVILDADTTKLKLGIESKPYAIKPNLYEFELLTGKKLTTTEEIVSQAKILIQKGIKLVAVSMGADGALFVSEDAAYKAEALHIECLSTVGAGDSMVAAMAYALHRGFDLEQTARLSVAAGSITSSKAGTQVCTAQEVMLKKDEVKIIAL